MLNWNECMTNYYSRSRQFCRRTIVRSIFFGRDKEKNASKISCERTKVLASMNSIIL